MNIITQTIRSQNITIVYEALDLQSIDTRKIKSLFKQTMVADIPDMIVVIDPTGPTIIQLGDRRIRVSLQRETQEPANISEIAFNCHQLVSASKLIAYGFNFDLYVTVDNGDVIAKIMQMFAPCGEDLATKLGGDILSVTPRLKFQRDHVLYDLILEPMDATHLSIHLNVHIEQENQDISSEILHDGLSNVYHYLVSILPSLIA